MQKGVVTEILDAAAQPVTFDAAGRTLIAVPEGWSIQPAEVHTPYPPALKIATLDGLREFLTAGAALVDQGLPDERWLHRDGYNLSRVSVQVESPTSVVVWDRVRPPVSQRDEIARVSPTVAGFRFGDWLVPDAANIALQSQFADAGDRAAVLAVIGSMRAAAATTYTDDGVTQAVQVAKGIQLRAEAVVPNPVRLVPYRTFREVEQPIGLYVLRVRGGSAESVPHVALFEADGGQWQIDAMGRIREWLAGRLGSYGVTVFA